MNGRREREEWYHIGVNCVAIFSFSFIFNVYWRDMPKDAPDSGVIL